jgi:iron complex outermembrane receptor protein
MAGLVVGLFTLPVEAEKSLAADLGVGEIDNRMLSPVANIPRLRDQTRPARTLKEWRSQIATATVQVTAVQLKPTEMGLEISLTTADSKPLQVDATKFRRSGNSLIADIPKAMLALPNAQGFNAENPTADVSQVQVVQTDASTIRVMVTGNNALPKQNVTLKTGEFTYSLKPEADEPEEEVVVTGDRPGSPYFAPRATTATRTDTPLLDVPASIQVIPRQVLEDQQVIRLEEALRNVAGVTTGGTNEGQGINIEIRGFTDAPVLLDGFRQYGLSRYQSIVETANLEQIEVLKGPASILYGEIQPGGVINLVSKRPLANPFYRAEVQIGSRNLFRPQIDFSGPLTADGKLLYRLNALVSNEEPFRDFQTNFQRAFVAPMLTWKISDRTNLTLQLEYLNNKQPFDSGRVASGDRVLRTPRRSIVNEPDDYTDSSILNVGYNFEHRFSDNWALRNAFRYTYREFVQEFIFPFGFDPTTNIVSRNFTGFDLDADSYSLQTYVTGKFATGSIKHTLLVGVDLNRTTSIGMGAADFTNPIDFDIFNPVYGLAPRSDFRSLPPFFNERVTQRRLGIYVQDQVDLLDNLILLAGVRYETVGQTTRTGETLFNPESSEVEQNDNAWTPRVGIVYQPIPALSLYASYSQSFVPNSGTDFEGNVFNPERGKGWETGIKAELLNRKLFATLAYFDIIKQNVSTADPINPFFSVATGEQRSRGVEFDISGQILPGWNILASYAYIDAEVTKDNTIAIGNRLGGIPKHSASLWTTYQIQRGDLQGLGAGFGFNFVGERQGDLDNSFKLDSYSLFNAGIFYKRNNWRIAVNFKNIGNIDYDAGTPFGNTRIGVGEPFTVVGSFSIQF